MVDDVIVKVLGEQVSNTRELLSSVGLVANQKVEMMVRRSVPLDMDWDGRVNRYEVVEFKIEIVPIVFNEIKHS